MESIGFYTGQLNIIGSIGLIKSTVNYYWVNLCEPIFWIASAVFILWNMDCHTEENLHVKGEPPWQKLKLQNTSLAIAEDDQIVSAQGSKKPNKRPFKVLKEHIVSWKNKKEDQSPTKKKIPFLRRFSTTDVSIQQQQKKKNFCSVLNKAEAIQKLKLLGSKLKRNL